MLPFRIADAVRRSELEFGLSLALRAFDDEVCPKFIGFFARRLRIAVSCAQWLSKAMGNVGTEISDEGVLVDSLWLGPGSEMPGVGQGDDGGLEGPWHVQVLLCMADLPRCMLAKLL